MFTLRKIEGGRINVHEPLNYTVGATAVTEGQLLVLSSGVLVACGADVKPTFIALANGAAGADIPVGRVEPNQVYETETASGVSVGAKYKLNSTADGITNTAATTAGAEIVALNGATVLVRF